MSEQETSLKHDVKKGINPHTQPSEGEKNKKNKSTLEPKEHQLSVSVSQLPGH